MSGCSPAGPGTVESWRSVSYMPGVNTGLGSISGTEVRVRTQPNAANIAQAENKLMRGAPRRGFERAPTLAAFRQFGATKPNRFHGCLPDSRKIRTTRPHILWSKAHRFDGLSQVYHALS